MSRAKKILLAAKGRMGEEVGRVLTDAGYNVTLNESALDAVDTLRTQHFDLVVTQKDFSPADRFGFDILRAAQESNRQMPRILIGTRGSRDETKDLPPAPPVTAFVDTAIVDVPGRVLEAVVKAMPQHSPKIEKACLQTEPLQLH